MPSFETAHDTVAIRTGYSPLLLAEPESSVEFALTVASALAQLRIA